MLPVLRNAMTSCTLTIMIALSASHSFAQQKEDPSYRIGTCDWSIKMPLSVESFRFARRNQLHGIQYSFDVKGKGLDLRLFENRETLRAIVKETGVAVSSLGIGALNKIPLATTDEGEQLVVECIETMARLKAEAEALEDRDLAAKVSPNIVLLAFFGKADINGDPARIKVVIAKLKRLAPLAQKHGFTLALESLLNEADHRHILDSVGSSAVKVYYDTANSARMGYDIYAELKSLGTQDICEIHIKENGDLLGQGDIDFRKIKSLLQGMQYKGWLIIEGSVPKQMDREEAAKQNAVYAINLFNP